MPEIMAKNSIFKRQNIRSCKPSNDRQSNKAADYERKNLLNNSFTKRKLIGPREKKNSPAMGMWT